MDRKAEIRPVPVLYTNKDAVPRGEGEAVRIPVTVEGLYSGNGQYNNPQDSVFRIVGWEKLEDGSTRYEGRAFIERIRHNKIF